MDSQGFTNSKDKESSEPDLINVKNELLENSSNHGSSTHGSDHIGMTKKCDVIIVGAGLSGLAAANTLREELKNASSLLDVVILEAKDRVGGRILSAEMKTQPLVENDENGAMRSAEGDQETDMIDMGGTWFGSEHQELIDLLAANNIARYEQYFDGESWLQMGNEKLRSISDPDRPTKSISAIDGLDLSTATRRIERLVRKVNLDNPLAESDLAALDGMNLSQLVAKVSITDFCRDCFNTLSLVHFGVLPAEVSALYFLFTCASTGGFRQFVKRGNTGPFAMKAEKGMQHLCQLLAENSKNGQVRLSEPVASIDQSGELVVVKTQNGNTFEAKRVMLAVPPAAASKITFKPPLKRARRQLNGLFTSGGCIRFSVTYSKPLWRDNKFSGEILATGLTNSESDFVQPIIWALDGATFTDAPALTGFLNPEWADKTPGERKSAVIDDLTRYFGEEAKEYLDYRDVDWEDAPFSEGASPRGYIPPGAMKYLVGSWYESEGRIHFAGAESSNRFHGLMCGAVIAGRRAALEILHKIDPLYVDEPDLVGTAYDQAYKSPSIPVRTYPQTLLEHFHIRSSLKHDTHATESEKKDGNKNAETDQKEENWWHNLFAKPRHRSGSKKLGNRVKIQEPDNAEDEGIEEDSEVDPKEKTRNFFWWGKKEAEDEDSKEKENKFFAWLKRHDSSEDESDENKKSDQTPKESSNIGAQIRQSFRKTGEKFKGLGEKGSDKMKTEGSWSKNPFEEKSGDDTEAIVNEQAGTSSAEKQKKKDQKFSFGKSGKLGGSKGSSNDDEYERQESGGPTSFGERFTDKAEDAWERSKAGYNKAEGTISEGARKVWGKTADSANKAGESMAQGSKKAWGNTSKGAQESWDKTKSGIGHAGEVTADKTRGAWDQTAEGAHNVGESMQEGGKKAWEGTQNVGHEISDGAEQAWEKTKAGSSRARETVSDGAHKTWNTTTIGARHAGEYVSQGSKDAWDKTSKGAKNLGSEISDGAGSAWDNTKQEARNAKDSAARGSKEAWDGTSRGAENLGERISEGTHSAWDKTSSGAQKAGKSISEGSQDVWESTSGAAKRASGKVSKGAHVAWDKTGEGVKETGEKISEGSDKAGKSGKKGAKWTKDGVEKTGAETQQAGSKIGASISRGAEKTGESIKHGAHHVKIEAENLGLAIKEKTSNLGKSFSGSVGKTGEKFKEGSTKINEGARDGWQKIGDAGHDTSGKIRDDLKTAGGKVRGVGHKVGDTLRRTTSQERDAMGKLRHKMASVLQTDYNMFTDGH